MEWPRSTIKCLIKNGSFKELAEVEVIQILDQWVSAGSDNKQKKKGQTRINQRNGNGVNERGNRTKCDVKYVTAST